MSLAEDEPSAAPLRLFSSADDIFKKVAEDNSVAFGRLLRFLRASLIFNNRITYVTFAHIWDRHAQGRETVDSVAIQNIIENLACACFGWPPSVADSLQKFIDHVDQHYAQAPISAGDRVLHNLSQPRFIQCLQKYDPHLRRAFLCATKNCNWSKVVSANNRLVRHDMSTFLKSAGLLLPTQGSSQSFSNEDVSLIFRASHHVSTNLSANQKPVDAADLSYCEFLEFLTRLALASNVKVLGDGNDLSKLQKLCTMLIAWSDDKASAQEDDVTSCNLGPPDCYSVPTFCELISDIYRLFVLYSGMSDSTVDSAVDIIHPDADVPRFLGLGALLRLLRDANVLDNEVCLAAVDSIVASRLGIAPDLIPYSPAPGISFDDFCHTLLQLAPKAFPSATTEGALTFLLENHFAAGIRPSNHDLDFLYEGSCLQLLRNYDKALSQLFVCYACLDDEDDDNQEITPRMATSAETLRQAAATPLPHSPGVSFLSSQSAGGKVSTGSASSPAKGEFKPHAPLVKTMKTIDKRAEEKYLPATGRFLWARDATVMFQDLGLIGSSSPALTVSVFQQLFDKTCKRDPASSFTKGLSFPEFQLLLCNLALHLYGAHDYADKFPSPQEKMLVFFERIEIGYEAIFHSYLQPHSPAVLLPRPVELIMAHNNSADLSRFVIDCRLSDGLGLLTQFDIPSPPSDLGFGSTVHRSFRAPLATSPVVGSPKKSFLGSGSNVPKLPVVPLLIREVLLAPEAPSEAAIMMEAATVHMNSKRPELCVDMLLAAMRSWSQVEPVPPRAAFYFVFSIGLAFESADLQQLAVATYELSRQLAEQAFGSSSCLVASALSQSGCIWFHQRQITAALRSFFKARGIREDSIGYDHADTASLLNNMAACFDCLNRFTEARDCYSAAREILQTTCDSSHPRIQIVSKNIFNSGRYSLDFEVSFEPLRAMVLPKGMVLLFGKSSAGGKKGKKGGGKKKK